MIILIINTDYFIYFLISHSFDHIEHFSINMSIIKPIIVNDVTIILIVHLIQNR